MLHNNNPEVGIMDDGPKGKEHIPPKDTNDFHNFLPGGRYRLEDATLYPERIELIKAIDEIISSPEFSYLKDIHDEITREAELATHIELPPKPDPLLGDMAEQRHRSELVELMEEKKKHYDKLKELRAKLLPLFNILLKRGFSEELLKYGRTSKPKE